MRFAQGARPLCQGRDGDSMTMNPLCSSDNPQDILSNVCAVCAFVQAGAFERGKNVLPLTAEAQYGCYLTLELCNSALRHASTLCAANGPTA